MTTPNPEFCSAMMYYFLLRTYTQLLDHKQIKERVILVGEKIQSEFYQQDGYFKTGSQSSYAFALAYPFLNVNKQEKVLRNFIQF